MPAPVVYKNEQQIVGNHLLFLREGSAVVANANIIANSGDAIVAGTLASAQYKPGIGVGEPGALPVWPVADPNWSWIGRVEKLNPEAKPMEEDMLAPIPGGGGYARMDVASAGGTLDIGATLQEMNELVWEAIMLANTAIVSGTAYVPAAGTGLLRGWLKLLQYGNRATATCNVVDVYVSMSVKTGDMINKAVKPQLAAKCLYSPKAQGILTW